ncbi:9677_t:CDS:10 [Funneliformis mosseae]|uniref:9677_t:CDS:1 n=1 Tax=Funneliformis mosseae TaxID=27381 RepID=A0A9N9BCH2_FUNMO|nr:9677_t:CDS:10 [Funneliformis mosseae]
MRVKNPKRNGSSALKRLKTTLKDVGLVGPKSCSSTSKKQKQKGNPVDTRKIEYQSKLNSLIKNQVNPFELKINRVKHDVLGKKIKGIQGRPGLKRQIGIEKRKKTLLVEMENKNKVGGVVDRRFGENDLNISPEEKMLERFTKERQKRSKSSLFNLDEEVDLTHYGQSLAEMDAFDDPDLVLSDEDDEGVIDMKTVARSHFGGFEDNNNNDIERKKSKNEIMKELIAKSKMHKYERQFEKDEDEKVRQELDIELDSIRNLLIIPHKPHDEPLESQESAFRKHSEIENKFEPKSHEKYEEYDRIVRELAFEKRGRPTDRTKTEEEIALEEKESLEKLERARKRRMEGISSESEEDDKHKRRRRVPVADDLEDDYLVDEDIDDFGLGKGITIKDFSTVERMQDNESDESQVKKTKVSKKEKNKNELAYTFPCPSTMEEFLKILEDADDENVPIVVQRIRVLYHIKLSPDNQKKLEKFFNILMDYIYTRVQETPCPMHLINRLSLQIFDLVQQVTEYAIKYFIETTNHLKNDLIKNFKFPKITGLIYFKLLGKIFPTSDFHHNIMTPTLLLIGQYLTQCHVINGKDLASGLFLCNILYEYQTLSRRIVPEAINFLFTTLVYLSPNNTFKDTSLIPGTFPFPNDIDSIPSILQIKCGKKIDAQLLKFSEILNGKVDNLDNDNFRISVLSATLHIIELYATLYNSTPAFIELFNPVLKLLSNYPLDKFSETTKNKINATQEVLRRLQKFSKQNRKPLELQHHKPIPIPTYIPKFQENFSIHHDPDKESRKINKLKSQYKKEYKGAIRELRKDNRFIARQHINVVKEKDAIYKKKINFIMGKLENEQGEKKAYEKAKKYGKL